jgi:hypothetical protein
MDSLLKLELMKAIIAKDTMEAVKTDFSVDTISISNDEAGNMFVEGAVTTSTPNSKRIGFHKSLLQEFAGTMNQFGLSGRLDEHQEFDELLKSNEDLDKIRNKLQSSPNNVLDVVSSKVEEDKLFVRAKVRSGFEDKVNNYNAFSIEALVDRKTIKVNEKGERMAMKGKVVGFVMTNRPDVPDSLRTK